jgi:hypothetical protein
LIDRERKKSKMAKVIGPLMSIGASGKLANTLVYDKRGFVREYVIPANPQTAAQTLTRNNLKDIQNELKQLGAVLREELKAQFGYRWNSLIISELMSNSNAVLDAYVTAWTAFITGDKTAWETADVATAVQVPDGALLYAVASATVDIADRLSYTISLTRPTSTNAVTVGGEWTDDTP